MQSTSMLSTSPFLEGPEKFSGPESHKNILNLMFTELFFSHNLIVKKNYEQS